MNVEGKSASVTGTLKHTKFAKQIQALNSDSLKAEVSYLGKKEVEYGTKGAVRLDAVEYNPDGSIKGVYDLKTGKAGLTEQRKQQILSQLPYEVPIYELRP